jgi:ATP-dependent Clp protease ATP-binding subunit ClpA
MELTLEFTRYLFGDESVFRFDMSEFLHLDNVVSHPRRR